MSTMDYLPMESQRVGQNPMLPLHPVTAAMDAQYAAQDAQLRAQTAKKYADVLQQLGYQDEQGNFIPGSVSVQAGRTAADTRFNETEAVRGVNEDAVSGGTFSSGVRVKQLARTEHPFETTLSRLAVDTPVQLMGLHEQAAGLISDYVNQNNVNLADAAARAAQGYSQNPVGTGAPRARGYAQVKPLPIKPSTTPFAGQISRNMI